MQVLNPPTSIAELESRAKAISNLTIGDIARHYNIEIPKSLKNIKGFIGQIIEYVLGADAGCLPVPDFTNLGIELKTLPININAKILETTYVCTAPIPARHFEFERSTVLKKLTCVLWCPYVVNTEKDIANYRIHNPFFWQPSPSQYELIKADWEELTELLSLGQFEHISSHIGNALQLRPKAAHSKQLINVLDEYGQMQKIVPKGFYLRTKFTSSILESSNI